jgi:hypothetical protein
MSRRHGFTLTRPPPPPAPHFPAMSHISCFLSALNSRIGPGLGRLSAAPSAAPTPPPSPPQPIQDLRRSRSWRRPGLARACVNTRTASVGAPRVPDPDPSRARLHSHRGPLRRQGGRPRLATPQQDPLRRRMSVWMEQHGPLVSGENRRADISRNDIPGAAARGGGEVELPARTRVRVAVSRCGLIDASPACPRRWDGHGGEVRQPISCGPCRGKVAWQVGIAGEPRIPTSSSSWRPDRWILVAPPSASPTGRARPSSRPRIARRLRRFHLWHLRPEETQGHSATDTQIVTCAWAARCCRPSPSEDM